MEVYSLYSCVCLPLLKMFVGFTHIITSNCRTFILTAILFQCVILFFLTHSSIGGHLHSLQVLAVINSTSITIPVQVFWWTYVHISVDMFIGEESLSYRLRLCLATILPNNFPECLYWFTTPLAVYKSFSCSESLVTLGIISFILAILSNIAFKIFISWIISESTIDEQLYTCISLLVIWIFFFMWSTCSYFLFCSHCVCLFFHIVL